MKNEKGITLIALVITIIVLLILAGVSISLVVGNNGVLTRATGAVEKNRESAAMEDVQMAWAGAISKYWSDWTGDSNKTMDVNFFNEELVGDTSNGKIERVLKGDDEGTYDVEYIAKDQNQSYTFIMDSNGKASLSKGNAKEIAKNNTDRIVNSTKVNLPQNAEGQTLYSGDWEILCVRGNNILLIANYVLPEKDTLYDSIDENSRIWWK